MIDENPDDEPMSAEEIAHLEEMERAWEAEAEQEFGPPAERRAKNEKYVEDLCSRYTEPVIRGLLAALSGLDRPHSARDLADFNLLTVDLADVIQPYELFGRHFEVIDVKDDEFTVEVSRGHGTVGDGGSFIVARFGEEFRLARELWQSIS